MRDTPNKPQTISGDLHNLPAAFAPLIKLPHWMLWRWEFVENNWTKVPYQTNGRKAKSNDPATWTSYDAAIKAMNTGKFDGIGFCLLNANVGAFDIDHCRDRDSGTLDPWAAELVRQCHSYTEITPSGTGLRIIGIGTGVKIDTSWPIANGVKLEAYRNSARYITVTGNPLAEFNIGFADLDIHIDETAAELDFEKQIQQDAGKGVFHEPQHERSPPAINVTGIELERFADAIDWVPNPDLPWHPWNRLGMSIHRATGGSEFGCRLFHKLSAKSSKYNAKATDGRWRHYHRSPPKIITGDTIYWEAHHAGWDGKCRTQREDKANKQGTANSPQQTIKPYSLVWAKDVIIRSKEWVWPGHILRGAQELTTGQPDLGKSQVQCSHVACITTGRKWPDGAAGVAEPANVIMVTAEDTLDQEIVPRLIAAGADLSRVCF